jgi:hypothetical protein
VAKKYVVGTITGVFDSALDGIAACLVRRRKFGYTVELLESKHPFQGSSALNRGHEHQRSTRRLSAREGRPRCLGRGQRGGGT